MYFSDVCAENKKMIEVVEMIFSYFLIRHVKRMEQKYNIKKYWGHRPSSGDTRATQVTLCVYIG